MVKILNFFARFSSSAVCNIIDCCGRRCRLGRHADGGAAAGAAARPPYFRNGSAAALTDVVAFYNQRVQTNLSAQDQTDLVHDLSALQHSQRPHHSRPCRLISMVDITRQAAPARISCATGRGASVSYDGSQTEPAG
jgi:hypothetical protein